MRALLVGAGKMGKTIASVLASRGHSMVREVDFGDRVTEADRGTADVAFEFTEPTSAEGCVTALLALGIPVVSGTTGWDPAAARRLAQSPIAGSGPRSKR